MNTSAKRLLTATERAAYLANVLSISKPPGEMSDLESEVLQGVISGLDATWDDVQKAHRMLANGTTSLRRMRSQHVKRDNIQDMIVMALADGDLTDEETKPIEKLTQMIGYSQVDMDMLVKRAETTLVKIKAKGTPPVPVKPRNAAEPHEIAPEPIAVVTPPPEPPPVEPYSDEPVVPTKPPAEPEPTPQPPAPTPPTPQPLNAGVGDCKRCRSKAEHPGEYCFGLGSGRVNVWGCRLMNMDWTPGADWLLDGSFRDDDTFVFDHTATARRIEGAVEKVRACPHLDRSVIDAAFERLPKHASTWGRWNYRRCKATEEGATHVNAVTYLHGQRLSERQAVYGLDPDGIGGALKIIRRTINNTAAKKLDTGLLREEHKTDTH